MCGGIALEVTHRPNVKLRELSFSRLSQSPRLARPETRDMSALDQLRGVRDREAGLVCVCVYVYGVWGSEVGV